MDYSRHINAKTQGCEIAKVFSVFKSWQPLNLRDLVLNIFVLTRYRQQNCNGAAAAILGLLAPFGVVEVGRMFAQTASGVFQNSVLWLILWIVVAVFTFIF